jgi:hypothetical protein
MTSKSNSVTTRFKAVHVTQGVGVTGVTHPFKGVTLKRTLTPLLVFSFRLRAEVNSQAAAHWIGRKATSSLAYKFELGGGAI